MVRRTTSLMTALGIALVVMVVVILLSFVSGLRQSLELAGEPGHWIVLSRGTVSEGESYIPREQSDILRTRPEIATDASGAELFSPEMVVPFNAAVNRPAIQFRPASLRGVSPIAYRMRRGLKLVAGRWPAQGRDEMAIGRKQAARFPGAEGRARRSSTDGGRGRLSESSPIAGARSNRNSGPTSTCCSRMRDSRMAIRHFTSC